MLMIKLFIYSFLILLGLSFQIKAEDIKLNCNYVSTFQNEKIVVKEKNKGDVLSFIYNEHTKEVKSYPYEFTAKKVRFYPNDGLYDLRWIIEMSEKFKFSYSFRKDSYSGIFFKGELTETFYHRKEKRIIKTNYYDCEKSIY